MLLNDLVSEQVRYGHLSRCATANHRDLQVSSPIAMWFPIQSFEKNNNLFDFFHRQERQINYHSYVWIRQVPILNHGGRIKHIITSMQMYNSSRQICSYAGKPLCHQCLLRSILHQIQPLDPDIFFCMITINFSRLDVLS